MACKSTHLYMLFLFQDEKTLVSILVSNFLKLISFCAILPALYLDKFK